MATNQPKRSLLKCRFCNSVTLESLIAVCIHIFRRNPRESPHSPVAHAPPYSESCLQQCDPLLMKLRTTSQCSGTSPNQSTPRGLETHVEIETSRHGSVNDGLLLLIEQCYQPPLGADVTLYASVNMGKVADDGGLLRKRRKRQLGNLL